MEADDDEQPQIPEAAEAIAGLGSLEGRAEELRSRPDPIRHAAAPLPTEGLSASARASIEMREAASRDVERRRVGREVERDVPVADDAVRQKLRSMQQPVTLFGEGPYERRLRLRQLVVDEVVDGRRPPPAAGAAPRLAAAVQPAQKKEAERFFTEGSAALKQCRLDIAAYSLPRAKARLAAQQAESDELHGQPRAARDAKRAQRYQDVRTLQCVASQIGGERPLSAARASPDGSVCLIASWDGNVRAYGLPSCNLAQGMGSSGLFAGHTDRVSGVAWHPGAQPAGTGGPSVEFASVGADKSVKLWSTKRDGCVTTLGGHTDRVNKVAFHPSGNYIATTAHDRTWRLWDVTEGREAYCVLEQEGHARAIYGIDMHPDGSLLVTTDLSGVGRIWDLRHGRSVFLLEGHARQVHSVAFSPNGWLLATGGDDHFIKMWDLRRKQVLCPIAAHSSVVSGVCFEPEHGGYLLSCGFDGALKAWDSLTGAPVRSFLGHDNKIMGLDAVKGGAVVTCSFDRTWKHWVATGTVVQEDVPDVADLLADKSRSAVPDSGVFAAPPAAAAGGGADDSSSEGLQELQ
eukprot:TRINITY_DN36459_c0_g1_i1.p1 TRINITY_DN36459_c0_g1~~TRINITY_DN36459_c0_g1_i1.p1  ORF type:complete len:589 (+),score=197.50 TRINITY_DN36459_c0_g1_i1:44-1768(+)